VEAIETALTEEIDPLAIQALAAQPKKIDAGAILAAQKLAAQVPAGTALAYSQEDGLGWADPAGWKVYVGMNTADLDQKLAVYQAIVQNLQQKGLQPAVISVASVNAPFYRLEP
jgi:hypothetical protein